MKKNQVQKQKQAKSLAEKSSPWIKPGLKVIPVSFECSAYAGTF